MLSRRCGVDKGRSSRNSRFNYSAQLRDKRFNLHRYVVGSTGIINIYDDDIAKIPIPILDGEIQKDIAEKVQNSFALRRQSKQLLEYAKQAVEMAIEQGEDAALVWLKERSGE